MELFDIEFITIFYLIDAANSGKSMIRVLSEDNDMQGADGVVGYDNAGSHFPQLHGMHALTNCDMTSYPYAKTKINALRHLAH